MSTKDNNKTKSSNNFYMLLSTVNFCEMDNDKLFKLLDFLGQNEILEKSKMTEKYEDGKCIEKSWEWYDRLNVYPQKNFGFPSFFGTTHQLQFLLQPRVMKPNAVST